MGRGVVFLALAFLAGCTSREPQKPPPQEVKRLFRTMGCTNCHDIRNTIGGPSFEAIAARYPAHPDTIRALVKRVKKGVRGRWKDVPLEECPDKTGEGFKDYEIRWMIEWILSRQWQPSGQKSSPGQTHKEEKP